MDKSQSSASRSKVVSFLFNLPSDESFPTKLNLSSFMDLFKTNV